ncbi:MAG: VWA domain-containing protein [Thermoanaerobaculia bacterium]
MKLRAAAALGSPLAAAMPARALALSLLAVLAGAGPAGAEAPASAEPPATTTVISPADTSTFLAEVEPLISEAERAAYLALTRPYQRQAFERRFWELRDPYPETARNELEERYRERLRLARELYPSPADDRFRLALLVGEPLRRIPLRCAEILRPGEIWYVGPSDRIPQGFAIVFVSRGVNADAPHRLWSPQSGYGELLTWSAPATGDLAAEVADRVPRDCPRGDEIVGALAAASDWNDLVRRYDVIPHPNPEWVRTFLSYSTDLPADALPLPAEVEIRFPGRNQSRTIVDASVVVDAAVLRGDPATPAAPPETLATPALALLLDGEVLLGEKLFDHFRYRFEISGERLRTAGSLPFAARRFLRPGIYTLVLRLQEPASGRVFRRELPLEVPPPGSILTAAAPSAAPAAPSPAAGAAAASLTPSLALARATAPAADTSSAREPSLRLLAPIDQLALGKVRVEADVRGVVPARVDFALDGKPLLSKRRAPFSIEIDLGRSPRLRRLSASAFDDTGALVAADEALLNAGPHRFALRLTEPLRTPAAGEPLQALAEVDLPEGEELDRVEFFLNETRLATIYQPPFAVALATPATAGLTYLRAVAYLAGGGAAEDVRVLGSDAADEAVDIDLVELYASVLDKRGRPVTDLAAGEFRVLEDGVEQTVQRFENFNPGASALRPAGATAAAGADASAVGDPLPIHAGVMIDTSASMVEELADAEAAADRFFHEVLTPIDRAAVITFADAPRLAVRFTANLELLAGGLAGLEAQGETRFFDSLAFALHYFAGVRGKRALILLTDGDDSESRFRFDEVLEYARRTGVAIYAIGLNVPSHPVDVGVHLDQLARETGGRSFRIRRANELASVYETIRQELRSQYLLAYPSSRRDGSTAYREITLEVARPGVSARTIAGYYP